VAVERMTSWSRSRELNYARSHLLFAEGREEIERWPWSLCDSGVSKDEVVVIKGGYNLTRDQRDRIGQALGPAEVQITEDLFIGPSAPNEREGGMMHLNHSCEPNLGPQGQIVFVAIRDIAAGEELTIDYAMTDDEPYEMECQCGSETCRKLITGADLQKRDCRRNTTGISRGLF
jgi:uncharacterized protein